METIQTFRDRAALASDLQGAIGCDCQGLAVMFGAVPYLVYFDSQDGVYDDQIYTTRMRLIQDPDELISHIDRNKTILIKVGLSTELLYYKDPEGVYKCLNIIMDGQITPA